MLFHPVPKLTQQTPAERRLNILRSMPERTGHTAALILYPYRSSTSMLKQEQEEAKTAFSATSATISGCRSPSCWVRWKMPCTMLAVPQHDRLTLVQCNDSAYEYDSIGFPFLAHLGRQIHQYETQRPRHYRPNLTEFFTPEPIR